MKLRDHVLVCGRSEHLEMVARELTSEQHMTRRDVVVISEREPQGLDNADRVHYVAGDPTDDATLERACIDSAWAAIVLADDIGDAQTADSRTILTALALEALNPELHTCVELRDGANRKHLRHAGVDEVVCLSEVSARLVAQSALNPRLATLLSDLLSFESGEEFYKVRVPGDFVGLSFGDALARFYAQHRAVLMGLERGEQYVCWSGDHDVTLCDGDIAVLVAASFPEGLEPA